ncbi:UNVERIFIED_CONTAM: rhoptry protein ROP13 [Hammondia hammondi]|eukprot:XP_008885797.1 rhoptry protein ROP13 [Hammondia hammondi]
MKRTELCLAALVAVAAFVFTTPSAAANTFERSLGHLDAPPSLSSLFSSNAELVRSTSPAQALSFTEGTNETSKSTSLVPGWKYEGSDLQRKVLARQEEHRKRQEEWERQRAARRSAPTPSAPDPDGDGDPATSFPSQQELLDRCLRQLGEEPVDLEDLCKGSPEPDDCRSTVQEILGRRSFGALHTTVMSFSIFVNRDPRICSFPVLDATDLRLIVKLKHHLDRIPGCTAISLPVFIALVSSDVFKSDEFIRKVNRCSEDFGRSARETTSRAGRAAAAVTRFMGLTPERQTFYQPFVFVTTQAAMLLSMALKHPFLSMLINMACVAGSLCRRGIREVLLRALQEAGYQTGDVPLDSAPKELVDHLKLYLKLLFVKKYSRVRRHAAGVAAQLAYANSLRLL